MAAGDNSFSAAVAFPLISKTDAMTAAAKTAASKIQIHRFFFIINLSVNQKKQESESLLLRWSILIAVVSGYSSFA